MRTTQFVWYYLLWHYTKAWSDMERIFGNYLWFVGNFFSIELLLKTLFSPWRRLSVTSGRGGEESFFGRIIINTLMRFVGFIMRACTIVIGVLAELAVVALGCCAVIIWLLLPVIIFFLFFAGIGYLFNLHP